MKAYELGVNSYVVKPVEFKDFVAAISDLGIYWAVLNEPPPGSLRLKRARNKEERTHNETVRLAWRTVSTIPAPRQDGYASVKEHQCPVHRGQPA